MQTYYFCCTQVLIHSDILNVFVIVYVLLVLCDSVVYFFIDFIIIINNISTY